MCRYFARIEVRRSRARYYQALFSLVFTLEMREAQRLNPPASLESLNCFERLKVGLCARLSDLLLIWICSHLNAALESFFSGVLFLNA